MKEPILFFSVFFGIIVALFATAKIISLKKSGSLNRKGIFNTIDRILVLISVFGILVSFLFDFNYLQYKAPIPHKEWKTISLTDFRGLKKPGMTLNGSSSFAFVSTSIHAKQHHQAIEIQALFHPARSYVFNRELFSERLLKHELYHFHITEYCARLLRKKVKEMANKGQAIQLDEIKKQILRNERKLQRQYDDETYHSYVHGKQIEWQHKIDSILLDLENYSDPIIPLKN